MADEAAFHAWLCDALSRVKLEDEAYVGILKEDTYQPDEKKDAVLEFLASSSEEDLTAFGDELMAHWNKIEDAKNAEQEEKKKQETEQLKAVQLQQQKEREEKAKQRAAEHQLSKEERLKRRELLERYGYQIETTDEHGDIVLTENLCDVQDTADVEQNDNVSKIVQESQAQREKAREKHQQKVLREKELLLKDQEKKEKRKRKTEKREKRRL
ncbi:uncharacterized protein ACA1_113660 [Acanthamoeba castellanii str. Neff]|uniref:CCDC43 PWI-like domain-containing protein n=1 Tax=Acanthamoeba castellanii (strain ATCC 30010 / Neff) TaxID=1257118 RepID=L8H6D0_ACACF|nr:uncharacterized protein ACA1_113660 [Acanthamoeba castellanii str. Neff]ELR20021.1 hypothetical protein ACA1_113660 [Acanthamoeba castellanii str. Neff]